MTISPSVVSQRRQPRSQTRTQAATQALGATVLTGDDLRALLAGEISELAARCTAPATASGPWLAGSLAARPKASAWAVVVRDSDDLLRAAVVVLDGESAGQHLVTLAGSALGHRSAVLADSPAAASLLGHAFTDALAGRADPVRVELGPVDTAAPWLADFAATLSGAEIVPTDPIPSIACTDGAAVKDYLTCAMQRTLRKARNRIVTDGREVEVRITGDGAEIRGLLPALERIHRERDHAQGRRSELDDDEGRMTWRARLAGLSDDGALELATFHLDGELAAHVLAIVEPTAYRVVEGCLATRWARYAPGRLLETAVLQRVLDDPALRHLDWMTAVASERLLGTNDAQPVSLVRVDYPGSH